MNVKGTAIQIMPIFIKKKFGEENYQQWLRALPEVARKEFSGNILPSSWYPIQELMIAPTIALCDFFYAKRMTGAEELGYFSAEQSLKGVYKIFIKFGSPEFIVSKASYILPTFYESSAMEVVQKEKNGCTVRITQFSTPHTVVEYRIKGWILRALEMSGTRGSSVNIATSMTKGDRFTDYVVSWE